MALLYFLCGLYLFQDESGNEVVIGVSLIGIIVASEHNHTSKFYR